MNDIQQHLADKIRKLSTERRALVRDVVDAILDGHEAGLTREQIAEDLFRGMVAGALP